MAKQTRRIELQVNPNRLASIIDTAVLECNELVNFHFNALDTANLNAPAERTNSKFRVRGPEVNAADRKALHESWMLAKAFQELLRAVRHALEEAHVFVALLTKVHRIRSDATLAEFMRPLRKKASGLNFPKLIESVNNYLEPKVDFSSSYVSLQIARNCLEHRAGIVSNIETHHKESFSLKIPRMKIFYIRNGEEIELEAGHAVDPGDERTEVDVFYKIDPKERIFKIGERLTFTPEEYNEISFACHFLGQQLSTRLPKPKLEPEE